MTYLQERAKDNFIKSQVHEVINSHMQIQKSNQVNKRNDDSVVRNTEIFNAMYCGKDLPFNKVERIHAENEFKAQTSRTLANEVAIENKMKNITY